ncbi:MAG: hypothetical protein EXS10_06480 [Phycisphaerales bacterium]|nr:hypothetical protein [Phycisphaerales bacterium]
MSSWKQSLRRAFALDDGTKCEPDPHEREVLTRLADEIAKRELTGPALAFLEMSRPLNGVSSAALHFFTPIASVLASPVALKRFAEFLEKRGSMDVLCQMLEDAEQRVHAARETPPTPPT